MIIIIITIFFFFFSISSGRISMSSSSLNTATSLSKDSSCTPTSMCEKKEPVGWASGCERPSKQPLDSPLQDLPYFLVKYVGIGSNFVSDSHMFHIFQFLRYQQKQKCAAFSEKRGNSHRIILTRLVFFRTDSTQIYCQKPFPSARPFCEPAFPGPSNSSPLP